MNNDLISREAVIDIVKDRIGNGYIVSSIMSLPSMHQQERRGEWTEVYDEEEEPLFRRKFYCSWCHEWNTYGQSNYCPSCGVNMKARVDSHEEDTDVV